MQHLHRACSGHDTASSVHQVLSARSSPIAATLFAAVNTSYSYMTKKGNRTFMFNSMRANATVAERVCRNQGGHLASYLSVAEQAEVEAYFVAQVRDKLGVFKAVSGNSRGCIIWNTAALVALLFSSSLQPPAMLTIGMPSSCPGLPAAQLAPELLAGPGCGGCCSCRAHLQLDGCIASTAPAQLQPLGQVSLPVQGLPSSPGTGKGRAAATALLWKLY